MIENLEGIRDKLPALDDVLTVLSPAESLTDDLAKRLLRHIDFLDDSDDYIFLIHGCHLSVRRNGSEWALSGPLRRHYFQRLRSKPLAVALCSDLLDLAESAAHKPAASSFDSLPWYLKSGIGVAYHSTQLDPRAGLDEYVSRADSGLERATWLADKLSREQADIGLLDKSSPRLKYVHGMRLYRDGQIEASIPYLVPLAESREHSRASAIAKHLVGRYYTIESRREKYADGVHLLRRSLVLGVELGDIEHEAQVRHTLAWVYLKTDWVRRQDVIFDLLGRSLECLEITGDIFGRAQVLHTLGRAYSRKGVHQSVQAAVASLEESIDIGELEGQATHVASVLNTLSRIQEGRMPESSAELAERRASLLRSMGVNLSAKTSTSEARTGRKRPSGTRRRSR